MQRKAARVAGVVLAVLATSPVAGCGPWMLTGLQERDADIPANQAVAFARMKNARASIARVLVYWSDVAPNRPPSSAQARDPNWSGYRWGGYDAEIRTARAAGLQPLVVVFRAPAWAEGSGKPPGAPVNAWKPSTSAFRDFAEAAARRYNGVIQPRVQLWQAWNEPNVNLQLAPQWTSVSGGFFPSGPYIYKTLLNAFYDGVKAASPSNLVITAGTAPYGLSPGGIVMRPAYFWRRVLCVRDGSPARPESSCPGGPARFDVLAHHPYTYGPPSQGATNPDDVAIPDMRRLTVPLNVSLQARYVFPAVPKSVWVTELGYESDPPDPGKFSLVQQAQYLEGAMYRLWKQGVAEVNWFGLRDQAEGAGWAYSYQSGLFFRGATIANDTSKPSLTAFRFPFTAYRTTSSAVELWGIAPQASTPVVVERLGGSSWTPIAIVEANDSRLFDASLNIGNGAVLRAVQTGQNSLPWTTRASGP